QAAAPDRLFLIDPLSAGPLDAFWRLVVDPGRVTVVHAGREEVRLCRLWTGQTPGNLFDLQLAAGLVGLTYPPRPGPLVRKLRGLGSLDRRRLAVVRALFQWREETAARTNRPARAIVRDDLILEIARRNPTHERDLHTLRGLPRRDLEAIVQTVVRAGELP